MIQILKFIFHCKCYFIIVILLYRHKSTKGYMIFKIKLRIIAYIMLNRREMGTATFNFEKEGCHDYYGQTVTGKM